MNRRDSLKALGIGTLSATALIAGCTEPKDKIATGNAAVNTTGRQDFEIARDKTLLQETFFDAHETATITLLADIIIPKDQHSGSAADAKVADDSSPA